MFDESTRCADVKTPLTDAEIDEIISIHNRIRAEVGTVPLKWNCAAPMFKSAAEMNAADDPVVRSQGSNVTLQKSLEWKVKKGDQEVGSGTNVVKFAQLGNRIITSSIEYEQVMMQPGTYTLEIKCEQHFSVCKDKIKLTLLNPNVAAPDPNNLKP